MVIVRVYFSSTIRETYSTVVILVPPIRASGTCWAAMVTASLPVLLISILFALQTYAIPSYKYTHGSRQSSSPSLSSSALPTGTRASISSENAEIQLQRLAEIARNAVTSDVTHAPLRHEGCTQQSMRVRRDWRAFTRKEKKAYINSVLCLQDLPSQTPNELAPGTRSRYDDFVATHINQTLIIHYTVCQN